MFNFKAHLFSTVILIAFFISGCQDSVESNDLENLLTEKGKDENLRIVSLSGTLTETLFALNHGEKIVGVDITSTYPQEIEKIEKLGHTSSIKAEGIISLNPTHLFLEDRTLDKTVLEQVKSAGIEIISIEREVSIQGTKDFIHRVAKHLNISPEASIIEKIDDDLERVSSLDTEPNILFIYGRGAGNLMVAGDETPLKRVIELAGGKNAVSGFRDYKPLSNEIIIQSNPDFILMFSSSKKSLNGVEGILEIPGISETKAGKSKNIIFMDGQLLSGFGPRVGEAVAILNQKLKSEVE